MKKNSFMRTVAIVLVIMSIMAIATTALATYGTMYVDCPVGETVRLRSGPGTSYSTLVNVPYGTSVQAEYYNSNWHKVVYNGYTGYMMSTFLSPTDPTNTNSFGFTAYLGGTGSSDNLVYNQSSTRVKNLQRMLVHLGYTISTINGNFEDQTYAAVRSFQSSHGLQVDGIAGKNTKKAIWAALNYTAPSGCEICN